MFSFPLPGGGNHKHFGDNFIWGKGMYKNVCFQFIDYRFLNIALLKKILATLVQANSFAPHPMAYMYQYYLHNFYPFYQYYVHK